MKVCRLADVATIDSGAGFPLVYQGTQNAEFPFLKVSDMNLAGNERAIQIWNHSIAEDVRGKLRAKAFPAGALIFPKIGAAIGTNKKRQLTRPSCVDNNVMAVVPRVGLLEPDFLYFLFLAKNLSDFASASNPPSIRKSDVENWAVGVPSISEQRRIVDLLSRAEGIVRLRREAEKCAAGLIPALFLDLFGDPATNPKGWPIQPLKNLVSFVSGGTPSKSRDDFWEGELPWVSPKDMKRVGIDSAIDHVNRKVLSETAIKLIPVGSVLIVVRGMILIHTVPVAQSLVPLTINQDMKAMIPIESLNGTYLLWSLRVRQAQLLNLVSTAAHGTKKIETARLEAVQIPLPPLEAQQRFADRLASVEAIQSQQSAATAKAQAAFDALLARCFDPTTANDIRGAA
ncbi:MAG: restriction endonuclease subunit S [Sulfuritalea sp.]|nr:restriction endonuclease subunit S [Sulfuritalea sp.]